MYSIRQLTCSLFCLQLALCLISVKGNSAEATLCAPLSRFKIDCNTCYCSVDGRGYTCTKRFCTSEVSLNYNEVLKDEPNLSEESKENYNEFLNDLAVNYNDDKINFPEEPEYNENRIDYGEYLKDDTEYVGSLNRGWRF